MTSRKSHPWAALAYVAILAGIVVGLLLLSLLVGDRGGAGRVVWLGAGLLLGGAWAVRSRLPILNSASTRTAVGGWLGLALAGALTLAVAPTSLASVGMRLVVDSQSGSGPLRAAPPTAVRRTGTLGPSTQASAARPSPSPPGTPTPVVLPADFNPQQYLGQGNVISCEDLASQAEAQAILRADPADPNVIDQDRDGIACESNPPPRDRQRVPRPPL